MIFKTWQSALAEAQILYKRWIGSSSPLSMDRCYASIQADIAATKVNPGRMTAGCLRESRNDLKACGSIRKHYPEWN